ncbi:MAG TPA: hypothetical protein VKC34_10895 [Blastocatellia bacterium]|nr:hypothetical protein [Blastocatellia bacterium]
MNNRGSYSDLPLEEIIRTFSEEYGPAELGARSFDEDVAREAR